MSHVHSFGPRGRMQCACGQVLGEPEIAREKEPDFLGMALQYLRDQPSNAAVDATFSQRGSTFRARIAPQLATLLRDCWLMGRGQKPQGSRVPT